MLRPLLLIVTATAALGLASCVEAPAGPSEAAVRGKEVFLVHSSPRCGTCHVLADAGARGVLGPNLDAATYSRERILRAVVSGIGTMPHQRGILTDQQMEDVATYVAEVAGR